MAHSSQGFSEVKQNAEENNEIWLRPNQKYMNETSPVPTHVVAAKYDKDYGKYKWKEKPERQKVAEKKTLNTNPKKYSFDTVEHWCPSCKCKQSPPDKKVLFNDITAYISIPNSLDDNKKYSRVDRILTGKSENVEYSNALALTSWIFTPTSGRYVNGNFNLYHTMVNDKGHQCEYIHVLVVKPTEYEAYHSYWGDSHVIIKLPETLRIANETCSVEDGGIGFSRLFVQLFAEHYGLKTIIMLDDNVTYVREVEYEMKNGKKVISRKENGTLMFKENVPLMRVLKHLEYQSIDKYQLPSYEGRLGSYSGPFKKYGILGVLKQGPGLFNVKQLFNRSHVCSLVLLNIEALKEKKVKYRPWPVREDLNLNNDCEEKGLWVCKFNCFAIYKRNIQSQGKEVARESSADDEDELLEGMAQLYISDENNEDDTQ